MGDRYQQHLEQALGPRIDGPLVIATIGSPVGSMANLFEAEAFNLGMSGIGDTMSPVSGVTRGRVQHRDGKDVRLPQSFAVALTATSVYFFQWKPFWGRVKIKKELAQLAREGLTVKVSHGKASATVFLLSSESTGAEVAFEMATLGMATAQAKVDDVAAAFGTETT